MNHPEGSITCSNGTIRIQMKNGRCKELLLNKYFVDLLLKADGLISQFLDYSSNDLAWEIMFGETPSQDVLRGKKLLERPMITLARARGEKFWFGFVTRPTKVTWRHRRRVLVSENFLDTLIGVADLLLDTDDEETENEEHSDYFWLMRGNLLDGGNCFTFNSVSALIELEEGKAVGIERSNARIWAQMSAVATFLFEVGEGSSVRGVIPDLEKPEISMDLVATENDRVAVTIFWNGFPQVDYVFDVKFLEQLSEIVKDLWTIPTALETIDSLLFDDDGDDGD